ncbi:MAG: nicotinamide riboside transporter PnuC [Dysgonamonadaceae bacterium]|jgi:nicotinamide mononucleotide transporter|nr:nicotinamide riboside transporter PnuC [Dysgonamonadaceae bacterium]
MEWIRTNIIEIAGFILALIYLFLEIKERWPMWIVGIVSSAFYVFIFFQSKIYAQMGLNAYFVLANIYGLYFWKFAAGREEKKLKISHIKQKTAWILLAVSAVLSVFIGYFLDHYTDSPVPYVDAVLAALSVVATWMIARKMLEHWYIWIVTDFFSVGLYLYMHLYPTALLYAMYGTMSFWGLVKWRASMKNEMNH